VSHETIYQSLFVQGRGALRHELHVCLRSGRAMRRNKKWTKGGHGMGKNKDMVMISERPAEVEDRPVPGHWEGDLILGKGFTSVGTLVERTTRYVIPPLAAQRPRGRGGAKRHESAGVWGHFYDPRGSGRRWWRLRTSAGTPLSSPLCIEPLAWHP
jgi:hypothetical protein